MGRHGRFSDVTCLLFGEDPGSLANAIAILRSYDDGRLYTFVDSFFVPWPYCKIESIEPTSRVMSDAHQGYFQSFDVRIFHAY